ncbi:DUF4136 domain-containing protein [Pseudomonas citronellolis]|uniref:DUF4136 domain-containing protein n=1 Tax=Pseudomonas citronellolis TaxID=53408 RepID=UPI0023E3B2DB|nr:DUF4136 domain-containing protein [Pseudomonas citronellolis]MDF3934736.1 DUF4136 domain-containing protein [Pseudomonas citronellolis]
MHRFLLPLLALLLAACAGSDPAQVSVSPAADGHQSTFSIQAVRAPGHRLDLEERFDTALKRAMEAKGYRFQAQGGELRVLYALGLERQTGVVQRPVATQDGVVSQTQITDSDQARLAMRILDESSREVLYQAQLSSQLQDPNLSQDAFDKALAKLLADFPPHKAQP